jgi:hypothetical protein
MSRDNDNGNDEEYYDEDQQYYNHKEIEAQFYSDCEDYDNTADPNEREAHLTGIMNDIDGYVEQIRFFASLLSTRQLLKREVVS